MKNHDADEWMATLEEWEARTETAEAEVERLAEINRELVSTHNTYLGVVARGEMRANAAEAKYDQLRAAMTALADDEFANDDTTDLPEWGGDFERGAIWAYAEAARLLTTALAQVGTADTQPEGTHQQIPGTSWCRCGEAWGTHVSVRPTAGSKVDTAPEACPTCEGADHRHSPDETWDGSGEATCVACGIHSDGGVWREGCTPTAGCGCITSPDRLAVGGDPFGCYCDCMDVGRDNCDHEMDER